MSVYGHGPTVREQSIIDLREAGRSVDEIAKRLDLSTAYVGGIVSHLVSPKLTDWQTPAAKASQKLLAALRVYRGPILQEKPNGVQ